MKEAVQLDGVRKWFGDDIINLSDEIITSIGEIFGDFGNCILSGCNVSGTDVSEGYALIRNSSGTGAKICKIDAQTGVTFPYYIVQGVKDKNDVASYGRIYKDAQNKDIINEYYGKVEASIPGHSEYITIENDDKLNNRFVSELRNITTLGYVYKKIDISTWDMQNTGNISRSITGLTTDELKSAHVHETSIIDDFENIVTSIEYLGDGGASISVGSSEVRLIRKETGTFDSINYNNTVVNRGYVIIAYTPQ